MLKSLQLSAADQASICIHCVAHTVGTLGQLTGH